MRLDNAAARLVEHRTHDAVEAESTRKTAKWRFRAAVRLVTAEAALSKRSQDEERRWGLEECFFEGVQRCEELGRLFQESSNPEELNTFFSELLGRLEPHELAVNETLLSDSICCFIKSGSVRVNLAWQQDEVEGPGFCASHFLRQRMKDVTVTAVKVHLQFPTKEPKTLQTFLFICQILARDHHCLASYIERKRILFSAGLVNPNYFKNERARVVCNVSPRPQNSEANLQGS
jgi:hypothetical protein